MKVLMGSVYGDVSEVWGFWFFAVQRVEMQKSEKSIHICRKKSIYRFLNI